MQTLAVYRNVFVVKSTLICYIARLELDIETGRVYLYRCILMLAELILMWR